MEDNYRIDSHKLIYHVGRVNQWLNGESIYPIYMEIGPVGRCNHRCIFCAFDYLKYSGPSIDTEALKRALADAARHGVKSVMYAGEGEPLVHKDIAGLVPFTKSLGIDVAVTTNGVLFDKDMASRCLGALSWIRVSFNAGTKETYAKVHRCNPDDFDRVVASLKQAVELKAKHGYACTIGVQILLLPQNQHEVPTLAALMKKIGVDYLTVKPFSKHPMSYCDIDPNFKYTDLLSLSEELASFSDDRFRVIFRSHAMTKRETGDRPYRHCLSLRFWAYIDASGNVYGCSAYLGNQDFCYGNIYKQTFSEIWEGERHKAMLHMAEQELDTSQCREICRLDDINTYLWELKHPSPHVNFI